MKSFHVALTNSEIDILKYYNHEICINDVIENLVKAEIVKIKSNIFLEIIINNLNSVNIGREFFIDEFLFSIGHIVTDQALLISLEDKFINSIERLKLDIEYKWIYETNIRLEIDNTIENVNDLSRSYLFKRI